MKKINELEYRFIDSETKIIINICKIFYDCKDFLDYMLSWILQ